MTHFKHSGIHIDVHWTSRVRLMPTGDKFDHENPFAESLIDRIMLNPEKGAQDTPLKGIRSDYFYTIKKKCFNDVATEDNGAYLNSRSNKESTLWGHLMMGNSKMLRSSIRVTMALTFRNLEMDVIMRLLKLMQKKYIL